MNGAIKSRTTPPRSTIAPLTPKQLSGVAAELRRIGKKHSVILYGRKFLDRADELRAEARAIEQRQREKRWFAARVREWMKNP